MLLRFLWVIMWLLPFCLSTSGRYRPGKDKPDPKTWKANFRCALNSLPDICELQEHSRKRGSNAYRVYRMMPSTQTHRRRRGKRRLRVGSITSEVNMSWHVADLEWRRCPVLSQGCGFSAGLEKDRPVQVMTRTPRTRGSPPPPDPHQTQHRRWRPPQETHSAALRHTVRCLLSSLLVVLLIVACVSW